MTKNTASEDLAICSFNHLHAGKCGENLDNMKKFIK